MPKQNIHYPEFVARFEQAVRDTMGTAVSIRDLCLATGLNQRTLLRAVRTTHGMTPCHYLRALRLEEARAALSSNAAPAASVTEVALRCGFRELGRFSVEYRATFGESPSETLRRAAVTASEQAIAER